MVKRIFCLLLIGFCFFNSYAQSSYKNQWNKVDQYIKKGLPKSALKEVDKIYAAAKSSNNDAQIVKALVFKISLNEEIDEDGSVKKIQLLEKEMQQSKQPAKSILASITAEAYLQYYQGYRWRILQRTATVDFVKTDIETWSANDFHQKIGTLYLASISSGQLLQQTKLETFDALIQKGNVRYLRPTLYDLLAHRALEYFKDDEQDIIKPAYAFEINDPEAFAPATEFVNHTFINNDSTSLHYKAILIFQDLLKFHLNDAKPDALIDADIERIEFVKQYSVINNEDQLYLAALQNIADKYSASPASARASLLIAQYILAKSAESNSDTSLYTTKKAKKIADKIVAKFPGIESAEAKNLLVQLNKKEVSLLTEKVNIPGEPFRVFVKYRNVPEVFFRIVKVNEGIRKKLDEENTNEESRWKKILALQNIRSWQQNLPLPADYNEHSTEVKVDGLAAGEYMIITSAAADFNLSKNPLAAAYFYVSSISYINNDSAYFVLDRKTGKPLQAAGVQVWQQRYDYNTRKYITEKKEFLKTDDNGYFKIKKDSVARNYSLQIFYKGDTLFLDNKFYSYRYYNSEDDEEDADNISDYEEDNAKVFLFTDRSIYRPGQMVYFKGIAVTKDFKTKKSKLWISKDSILVLLKDPNYQKTDSLKCVVNEFGSFNGKFRLPTSGLTGKFQIEIDHADNVYISVEEYKRPKFYAEFETIKGNYHVNDTVQITGFAKAYAGNNVDGGSVKYTVTRVARFIYPWMWWGKQMPRGRPLEIAHGEIKTDSEGKFIIRFNAIPDLSVDKNTDPVFDYEIHADVTDINGETRSATTSVSVGYKALQLSIDLPVIANRDSLKQFTITAKNLSGQLQNVNTDVKIYKLLAPQRLIRNRFWAQPDQFAMTQEEFLKYFPNDEYNNESKMQNWERGEIILSASDSTNTLFKISNSKLVQGWYVAEATAVDRYGQPVKDVKYFQIYDLKSSGLPQPDYLWNTTLNNVAEPGEKIRFITGTSAQDVFLIQQISKLQGSSFQYFNLNNEKKIFEFPVTEDDRGGYNIAQFFVKDNRVYTYSQYASVPWTNKQLDISFSTFRDKTLPGSEEKWKVKISGYKGQKVAAEMLASMYDASLDQFEQHSWDPLNLWTNYYGSVNWNGRDNFVQQSSFGKWYADESFEAKIKNYDELITLLRRNSIMEMRGRAQRVNAAAPQLALQEVVVTGMLAGKVSGVNVNFVNDSAMPAPPPVVNAPLPSVDQTGIQIRKNFNETAFFFPDLKTDSDGNIEFSFTMPEALTSWKLMALAHTKDLASGYATKTVITQKELMLQPAAPRFLREGDKIIFTAKVVNLSSAAVAGNAQLQLFNAATNQSVDISFKNVNGIQKFNIAAGQSTVVKFDLQIPFNYNNAVTYRIVAKAGAISDGEEMTIPVLTNKMLVTETITLPLRGDTTRNFSFQNLLNSGSSSTLKHYALTVEYTTNPAWYAVQALPYLMEYPYECAEQTFSRYYANSIAAKIVNVSPRIKAVFERWKNADTAALLSNLQKNQELKSVLLEETPWVLEAQNETQQKKNIALLFDLVRIQTESAYAVKKLKEVQLPNGGFPWFKGGNDDRYITQYIVTGIGHLQKLNAINKSDETINVILKSALPYLDKRLKEDYDYLVKYKVKLNQNNLSSIAIQYLYMKSFFPDYKIEKATQPVYNYYLKQAKQYWLTQGKYMQAMIAIALNRSGEGATAKNIMRSLKEKSINNEELGMYWKEFTNGGYYWNEAPIESQAMIIEAFTEVENDNAVVDDLKTWLLKNKQTSNWHTTKATAEACYALLLQGTDWLMADRKVNITLGSTSISPDSSEAGTGYFKRHLDGNAITPEMGNISVTVKTGKVLPMGGGLRGPSWGAVYWQYFEDLDKINVASGTPLKLTKKLFVERNTDRGAVITPLNNGDSLIIGDKIKVRIELRVDRYMEYVHMKDMRASCMEPVNVLSQYKWQDGLGYYESTRDASTNFFFDRLNKGTYVFEYPMFVTHSGNFSNGVTTIQCMYAPEFSSHSEGVRVSVK